MPTTFHSALGGHGLTHFWAFKNQSQANSRSADLLSNSATIKWFFIFDFCSFLQLESAGPEAQNNLYCALSTVTRSGPFYLFLPTYLAPFLSCGEGQVQTEEIQTGRGWSACLPTGCSSRSKACCSGVRAVGAECLCVDQKNTPASRCIVSPSFPL